MVESIAATSLLGHRPIYGIRLGNDVSNKQKSDLSLPKPVMSVIKAQAVEVPKEAYSYREKEGMSKDFSHRVNTGMDNRPGLWPLENKADNSALHNPLLRQERMDYGWLGVIFEWEGVIVEGNPDLEKQAWLVLSEEEGRSPPPTFILRRIEGMKNEQAIGEVLCWSRDPNDLKRMASRKEEIYQDLHNAIYRLRSGSHAFVSVLMHHKVPMALVSTRPRKSLERAVGDVGIENVFNVIVAAEDVHRGKPDPEMFLYAAQLLHFVPERCIVFGNSNQTIEAAQDARMKCVAVASKHPVYELGAADLVVTRLDELSVVDLKNLVDIGSPEFGSNELPEMEMEVEADDDRYPSSSVGVFDDFY
ncbi:hypothetical protein OROMI_020477 [Orobanche minor]